MQEDQFPQTRTAVLEETYSFTEIDSRPVAGYHRSDRAPASTFRYRVLKRTTDIFLVLAAAPLILLAVGIVAAMVALSSPGPIFYSHRRIRKNGAFFSMWKFRTMCLNSAEILEEHLAANPEARAEWNRDHKLRHDPRITPVGALLRKYSLDEIPQFWNVLMGQMSLVGPRPIVAAEVEKYADDFNCYCRVKPGLTGLWQISGRSGLDYPKRVALDCNYVRRWSLHRDFVILLKTFSSVIRQDGAY